MSRNLTGGIDGYKTLKRQNQLAIPALSSWAKEATDPTSLFGKRAGSEKLPK
jgi:hypothetical protein